MAKRDPKAEQLRQSGILNPHPQRVLASWFARQDGFFDPRDLVQVKYEMLRYVHADGASKAEAAALFGLSRPTLYQAEAAFAREGLAGLLPQRRGPKGAHKLTAEVMAFIEHHHDGTGAVQAPRLARLLATELGVSVHPRSIERALARKKKR